MPLAIVLESLAKLIVGDIDVSVKEANRFLLVEI